MLCCLRPYFETSEKGSDSQDQLVKDQPLLVLMDKLSKLAFERLPMPLATGQHRLDYRVITLPPLPTLYLLLLPLPLVVHIVLNILMLLMPLVSNWIRICL